MHNILQNITYNPILQFYTINILTEYNCQTLLFRYSAGDIPITLRKVREK